MVLLKKSLREKIFSQIPSKTAKPSSVTSACRVKIETNSSKEYLFAEIRRFLLMVFGFLSKYCVEMFNFLLPINSLVHEDSSLKEMNIVAMNIQTKNEISDNATNNIEEFCPICAR